MGGLLFASNTGTNGAAGLIGAVVMVVGVIVVIVCNDGSPFFCAGNIQFFR